ncbi:hypothetical protein QQ045_015807 [Rhodiola kirilowii]
MANRLKSVLNQIISVNQSAFIPDMSKAYDRVNWKFLEDIQLKLGFPVERSKSKRDGVRYLHPGKRFKTERSTVPIPVCDLYRVVSKENRVAPAA